LDSLAQQICATRVDDTHHHHGTSYELPSLPGSVLVDLYIRLRDEIDSGETNLDPNHTIRAPIAMAILATAETLGADIDKIEAHVREVLGLTPRLPPIAA
jgi:hypothetical protein